MRQQKEGSGDDAIRIVKEKPKIDGLKCVGDPSCIFLLNIVMIAGQETRTVADESANN